MKTTQTKIELAYKLVFIINTVLGGVCLAAATVFDYTHVGQTATFSGYPLGAIVCLFAASLCYSKYLSLHRQDVVTG